MGDSDLEAIRQARLQELQQKGGGEGGGGGGGKQDGQQEQDQKYVDVPPAQTRLQSSNTLSGTANKRPGSQSSIRSSNPKHRTDWGAYGL